MSELLKALKINPLFSHLDEKTQLYLASQAIAKTYRKGEAISRRGDIWPYIFLISRGNVEALKESADGRSLVVGSFSEGEIFWGLAFFEMDASMPVTLNATCLTELFLWSQERMQPILKQYGEFSWELSKLMIRRMMRVSEIVEELAFQPVARRLARLLLDHFKSAGEESIERALTLDEMAARVGTTREMVCRALYRFADQKLIEVTRTEFVLTDKDGLKAMAGNNIAPGLKKETLPVSG